MQKDFNKWNNKKKKIHNNSKYLPLYHERQIRWCRLGVNIGFEQDGAGEEHSRPVLIVKAFSRFVCLIVPLTTSNKQNKYRISIGIVDGVEAFAIISQLRLIDTKRLDKYIETLNKNEFIEIKKAIKNML